MTTKILLADDSVTIQKVVELTFSDKNYEVTTVSNGESAIRRAREKRPDIILLDVIMPGMDGYEVCSVLKQDPDLKEVPVLLLTGTFEVFDTERSQRVGANGFITKPFESQELIARVRRLVSHQQSEAAPAEEDLDADLMLPELERDEPVELKKGSRQAMEDEDFPDFTFDTDTESTDSEILFDFSMDTLGAQGTQRANRAVPARGEPAGRISAAESQMREAAAEASRHARPPGSISFDEDDEPTFELPEFDLPDDGLERSATSAPSLWDVEDQELTTNLAAITAPATKGAEGKAAPAARTAAAEDNRFVFEEARELAKMAAAVTPHAPVDLQPLLERLERLEASVQRVALPSPEAIQMLERMGRFEALLGEHRPAASAPPVSAEDLEAAIQKRFPQILNQISETIQSKLPEIVDRAADKLTGTIAAQFVQRLENGGLDSREIITAIAWQVVPDVAEMLVRRELEEIRRHI